MKQLIGATPSIPPALAGFEAINRSRDRRSGTVTARILPGEVYVTVRDEAISTTLGSCISVCIRDTNRRVGGMNHFMLPGGTDGSNTRAACYGNFAMEMLINGVLKSGGRKRRLEAKVFGGASMFDSAASHATNVGNSNVGFVLEYLVSEEIPVVASDVGEIFPRQVIFLPHSGKARVRRLPAVSRSQVTESETQYKKSLETQDDGGDIELF